MLALRETVPDGKANQVTVTASLQATPESTLTIGSRVVLQARQLPGLWLAHLMTTLSRAVGIAAGESHARAARLDVQVRYAAGEFEGRTPRRPLNEVNFRDSKIGDAAGRRIFPGRS
jgi:hypothetical protein